MEPKIADCPECRSTNTIMGETLSARGTAYMVCCGKCGANSGRYELRADAREAWARRGERAIRLTREGNDAVVSVETPAGFINVIRERYDGAFCHIVEPSGIARALS